MRRDDRGRVEALLAGGKRPGLGVRGEGEVGAVGEGVKLLHLL